ncbi:GNAT family N-acetyltransferase [Evansella tamaricis]|uniref:GNAT family N-acetyltransferase n=1 Tax=Evansella tamaricis TaxID=2069301 RepID=A0ABS6JMQ0_9BACI|nr:GNAT family N-acetyltransferase [Evansella tamaricis]MBU9714813.1 GNAT family N-acetyltransferase [Evansella tamaricis]
MNRQITITEYKPELAGAVAEMWNKSREGWGGHSDVRTEDQVLSEEANSTNLHTYIAMDGEEVVGYCGLSEYREDEGALYIPLLNVRTDYHGKKVGKKLVLKALEETIKRGWPRLDLNTWPGNTKAVPLYKKCGFFWENRDDSVHLMNFIPEVLNTSLFHDFFQTADWYEDSVREIEIAPDGQANGEFDFYDYKWEKNSRFLYVSVEKTSRGICAFETEQFKVAMEIDHHANVFGKSYPVRLHIENRGETPLEIQVEGQKHHNIEVTMDKTFVVENEELVTGEFVVLPTESNQSTKKTHPSVMIKAFINGKEVTLKTGVFPKAPVKCEVKLRNQYSFIGKKETAFIELENNCLSHVQLTFSLPSVKEVEFSEREWVIPLRAKEKQTISVDYHLQRHIFFDKYVEMFITLENGDSIEYKQRMSFPLNTFGKSLFGECQEYYHLFSGMTHVALKKENNGLLYERGRENKSKYWFLYPKLGKPFSEEFSIKQADAVEFFDDNDRLGMKLAYTSRDFPQVALYRIVELSKEGLMSQNYEIVNRGEQMTDLHLNFYLTYFLKNAFLPYNNKLLFNQGSYNKDVAVWDDKQLTENWFFAEQEGSKAALIWEQGIPIHFRHWNVHYLEESWEHIGPGGSVSSKTVWFGLDVFSSKEEVREFALQAHPTESLVVKNPVHLSIEGSPITGSEATIVFRSYLKRNAEVNLALFLGKETEASFVTAMMDSEREGVWKVDIPVQSQNSILPVKVKGTLSSEQVEERTVLFLAGETPISFDVNEVRGHSSYEVNNGVFTIKAAPGFYPGIYSMEDGDTEWLHSSFPEPMPKSWWNPWIGGISFGLEEMSQWKMFHYPSTAQFVSVVDQWDQKWEGIQITTVLKDHPKYKGAIYHQFAVTRPGLPVLALFSGIDQQIGHHFFGTAQSFQINIDPTEEVGTVTVTVEGEQSKEFSHHHHEAGISGLKDVIFRKKGVLNQLHFLPRDCKDMEVYMNKQIILAGCETSLYTESGSFEISAPHFLVLSEIAYNLEDYEALRAIRFKR